MNWYYVEQGKQTGPANEEQFNTLVQSGKITTDTLVWREGMADWLPYGQVHATAVAGGAVGAETKPQAVCAECGKMFPEDETIRYGDRRVCASCKPAFIQKLQEGAAINTGELAYASFWSRFGAYFLDLVILMVFNQFIVRGIMLIATGTILPRPGIMPVALTVFVTVFPALVGIAYEAILIGKYGATLGKMALKIKVVTADGGRVSYARAFGRYFGKILSGFTCAIGFLIAAFDNPQRRALHDHICNTRVVYK
ncbi:MAG TPA: RDD family protein [Verrucomicrobiae bacterium]|jgi:uncharacterized RDD family membrane protein YckC|nr:RDD family protein [Verrucomicrobiae bacterium]